jgi:hypothetical protein
MTKYKTFIRGFTTGDFNNDGLIDVFNAGDNYIIPKANFSFLI